ncbi:hypothetical protein [Three spot gourami iridovirus]|nr:hypothetical protein [South American cichlid iridovirus]AVR29783.1 hypothetical protein [Three spot gourami iridovirus]
MRSDCTDFGWRECNTQRLYCEGQTSERHAAPQTNQETEQTFFLMVLIFKNMEQIIASKQKSMLVGGVALGVVVLAIVRTYGKGASACQWEPMLWYSLSGASIAILAQLIYGYYYGQKRQSSM